MILRWLISAKTRQAVAMYRHVEKILASQRDILSPQAAQAVHEAIMSLRRAVGQGADAATLAAQMENLEKTGGKWFKPYPNAAWRENIEVFLVAIAVAMAIRTFFLQPFKIPTGSMQPTLYGVMPPPYSGNQAGLQIPGRLERLWDYWMHGESYFNLAAPEDGQLQRVSSPSKLLLFNLRQDYLFNNRSYTVWFPADNLFERAGFRVATDGSGDVTGFLNPKTREMSAPVFSRGQDMVRLKVVAGDHLFVNRVTYNFRNPQRGEIVVFSTRGIDPEAGIRFTISPDQYYIKRLVGLGGDKVQIGDDHHLIINGQRLDSSTPHFENVYGFRSDAKDDEYFGHTQVGMFSGSNFVFNIQADRYMVMGDNTRNSLDSRFFGDFDRSYVIGKSSFVYWPISDRFGFGYR